MPEGDTIFRTASTLRAWIGGRVITHAWSRTELAIDRVVGRSVASVEANGKHLLITFQADSVDDAIRDVVLRDLVLQTHMLMTGSWHVYQADAPWQRPRRQASVILETHERIAVGFNVPIIRLLEERATTRSHLVGHLGPDVLRVDFDADEVARRIATQSPMRAIGEVLLDQRVVAGIGNIYRCEALFATGIHPWAPLETLPDQARREVVAVAGKLMRRNVGETSRSGRDFGFGANQTMVYRRAGRPCLQCEQLIVSRPQGPQARTAYWCPTCQPELPASL